MYPLIAVSTGFDFDERVIFEPEDTGQFARPEIIGHSSMTTVIFRLVSASILSKISSVLLSFHDHAATLVDIICRNGTEPNITCPVG
jgi:hypothetical protein